jgi:two-component system sensor histidine kinase CpxA
VSRLFVRIWLGFWAVLAVTFVAAYLLNYLLAVSRANGLDRMSPATLAASGAADIAERGEAGGRHWLAMQRRLLPELTIYVIAPGEREITGRSPSEIAHALAAPKGRSPFPAAVDEKVGGQTYRFVFQRTSALAFDLWDIVFNRWVLGGLILVISGIGAALLTRSITNPVQQLRAQVRAVANGDLSSRIGPPLARRGDELGVLARNIDDMTVRLQALIAAREALLRDVSHELRAPLARLRAAGELAVKGGGKEAAFARIDREIDRLDALIGQFLKFSRLEAEPALALSPVDLSGLAEDLAEDARLEGAAAGKQVIVNVSGPVTLMVDMRLIRSAVENVLRNAVRFSPPGGAVEIDVDGDEGEARLQVLDRGPGVPPEDLPHIFEPFHGEGSGAGLGLAIAHRVIRLHGGRIAAENREDGGFAVTISLPLSAPD